MLQGSPRPGLYHHGSKSMVDLLSLSRKGKDVIGFPARGGADSIVEKRRSRLIRDGPPTILEDEHGTPHPHLEPPEESILAPPTLRRQRSLPTYKPRDEEGYEWLPSYSNSVYLAAVMPRKLEFSQPGVQARDRKWRRVLCVLEGTVFKVYKCPSGVAGVSAIEQWWERKVGVGDIATGAGPRERPRDADSSSKPTDTDSPVSPALQEASANSSRSQAPVADPPTRSKFRGLLRPTRSSFSALTRPNVDIPRESRRLSSPPISTRQSSDTNSSRSVVSSGYASNSTSRTTITTPSSSSDGSFFFSRNRGHAASGPSDIPATSMKELPEPDPKELIRSYTLQRAESGLASDYIKRKNVVRVRMEGEQFLLQAQDVAGVISWIENIQAATNIALDLDERPMPKGPMFPRRRRRRIRAVQDHNTTRSLTIAAEPRTASG
ncbi:hypothetical protein B0H21DRAFT_765826 [Amylocystis lapponica]|nr:hypothetical protein B0H21DRAFT_765826 [Amylocystis lapponica]